MTPTLYDADFNQWLEETAKSLRAGNFGALDLENLIEEIESIDLTSDLYSGGNVSGL